MAQRKNLKASLIRSIALIGTSIFIPANAFAVSCPSIITGTAFSGLVCDFDAVNNVTISNGAEVGGINQQSYNPTSSFILNNGTISISNGSGLHVADSSLTNGISNNGTIITVDESALLIDNSSVISGGVSNTGTITSQDVIGFQLDMSSTINGNITNSGSIISNSFNNPSFLIRDNSIVNGNIDNSNIIRAYGIGDAVLITDNSVIDGNITNSGNIRGGGSGIAINFSNINGNIINNGIITGDDNQGIRIINSSAVTGNISNNGTITGGDNGLAVESYVTVNGSINNQAGANITGTNIGLYINDSAIINGGITNSGTITGGTYAIYVSADSTANNIDLIDGSRVIGAIDAVNSSVNIIGIFNSEGTINANSVNIGSSGIFTMRNAITAQNALTNSGALDIGESTQTITGDYTQSVGGILKIGAQNTTAYGQLTVTGAADLSQSGLINVDVVNDANIATGNVLTNIISGSTFVAPSGGFNITDNSKLLNFAATLNGSNIGVDLTAVDDSTTSVSESTSVRGNRSGAGAAQQLDEIIALNPGGDWQNVIGALNILSTDQQIADAVSQTIPALTGATNTAIIGTMSTASRIIQARQEANSGLSSGDDFKVSRNVWLKTFGSWGNQDNQDGVIGYNAEAYGLITGADKLVNDKVRLGFGASYFNSDLSSNDGNNQVDVDSYLGMAYGSYSLDDRTDINAQIEAGYNNSASKRIINIGGLNRVANGDYNGWSLHAGTGISRQLNLGSKTTITPKARLDYYVVTNESYNESGAGVLNLNVDSQTEDQLIPALEVKTDHKLPLKLSLTANAGIGYDVLNDNNTVSASFAGGGGTFVTRGLESSPWIIRSGAGLTWNQSDEVDLTARYDRQDRGSSYDDQTVSLKLRVAF